MNFRRVNNFTGWMVCLISCFVYVMTMEATGSFWDCGEFISSAYKVQIPHPPGAPLFVLMGRIFIVCFGWLFGNRPEAPALAVNFMNALASGFTILFLFWSITHFARKIIVKNAEAITKQQLFTIMAAGVVGALAYTFCDSFWYSAVEGEVYAMSSLFTALVFWAMLKWEHQADRPGSDKWIIFIFFMMGLSIGVHLLNLLTIPAIVIIYYFKRYKVTAWGTVWAFLLGCIITGFVQVVVIQFTVRWAGLFDIWFVNSLHLPFFSGFAFFFVLLAAILVLGLRIAKKRNMGFLNLGIWCFIFMLIGYSSYVTTMIRSNANPAVDMFKVDNPVSLVGYLTREQYGDWPILYGPDFTDRPSSVDKGEAYVKGKNNYEIGGRLIKQDWANTPSSHFFPRMWDGGTERGQAEVYKLFSGLEEGEAPTMGHNLKYFFRYQMGWMYLRYFMWNFAGKQNDLQGFGNSRDGNWISGIPFIDNALYGDQSKMPDSVRANNKSYNRLYLLPLLLGVFGLIYQCRRNRRNAIVTLLLFFFTGPAIVIYLNQAGFQPRERDYAYVGSFYVFAMWIGIGVIWVQELLGKYMKNTMANYTAAGLCLLAVPVLMASQEWNDHDRSKKTLARDVARNYLESCPPNAILFSFGDNDTYPLWYAQEVEHIRPDVRVVVSSLLGTDWFMNQLRYKINQSAPFDVIFTPQQILGSKREVMYFQPLPGFDQDRYYGLDSALRNVLANDGPQYTGTTQDGQTYNMFPIRKFSVPVDINRVKANGMVHPGDSVVQELQLDMSGKNYLLKSDLAILAIIATNKWERPVCFTSGDGANDLGIGKYVRQRGLSYQLVPVENSRVDNDAAYATLMKKFAYGNADKKGVYYDEENRRHLSTIRLAHAQIAMSLAQSDRKKEARDVLEHYDKNVRESNFPYGMTSNRGNQHNVISFLFLQACYLSEDHKLAAKVEASLKRDLQQQMVYYRSLGDETSDEQMAKEAYMGMQGKGSLLSDGQAPYANDIVSTYQILLQIDDVKRNKHGDQKF